MCVHVHVCVQVNVLMCVSMYSLHTDSGIFLLFTFTTGALPSPSLSPTHSQPSMSLWDAAGE